VAGPISREPERRVAIELALAEGILPRITLLVLSGRKSLATDELPADAASAPAGEVTRWGVR
jgi:hypothetical protein